MIDLITLEQAKGHSEIDGTAHDAKVAFKVSQASDIVLDYLKLSEIPEEWFWSATPATSPTVYRIPPKIQAAVMLVFGELWENRESSNADVLSERTTRMLERMRDPALA